VIVWCNGSLSELDDARISPLDHGLTVGDGVFETLRVYGGTPFAWRRHLDRLAVSADGLGLELPKRDELRSAVDGVLRANQLTGDARVRITVTGGPTEPGSSRHGHGAITAFVVAVPFTPSTATADVVIAPWTRNERGALAGLKTISYGANVRALAFAETKGATEAIFANTKMNLCEATGSNVFVVHDGMLCTPPPQAGCLLGVTRGLVLELCADLGIDADECDLPIGALATADEAFLSSTTREVQPIAHVDGAPLGSVPGPVSQRLARAFSELVSRSLDP
jgi:branched-chain amino acid aminotransferase